MKIGEVIQKIKDYHKFDASIDIATTRDQILYGDALLDQECTGIVTSCWASADVVKEAKRLGANLIITHEALFWNHGDDMRWLQRSENKTYQLKKALLDDAEVVVWRDHDHIHAGIPMGDGKYVDGIFYGLLKQLGWTNYVVDDPRALMTLEIPETSAKDIAKHLITSLHLNGARIIGSPDTMVRRITIPYHILDDAKPQIRKADRDDIDMFLGMELIDFTLSEYIRDASQLGQNKVIVTVGHFNSEEPGMKYMTEWVDTAIGEDIPAHFVKSGDMYHYVTA